MAGNKIEKKHSRSSVTSTGINQHIVLYRYTSMGICAYRPVA